MEIVVLLLLFFGGWLAALWHYRDVNRLPKDQKQKLIKSMYMVAVGGKPYGQIEVPRHLVYQVYRKARKYGLKTGHTVRKHYLSFIHTITFINEDQQNGLESSFDSVARIFDTDQETYSHDPARIQAMVEREKGIARRVL